MNIKKILCITTILLLFTACGNIEQVKTYPSLEFPAVISKEKSDSCKANEPCIHLQEIKTVTVRDLDSEENEKFMKIVPMNTMNDLNKKYKLVEFFFGEITYYVDTQQKLFTGFSNESTYFVYNDELLDSQMIQLDPRKEFETNPITTVYLASDGKENRWEIGNSISDYSIKLLVNKDYLKKGLQLKTTLDSGEVIYIDINE